MFGRISYGSNSFGAIDPANLTAAQSAIIPNVFIQPIESAPTASIGMFSMANSVVAPVEIRPTFSTGAGANCSAGPVSRLTVGLFGAALGKIVKKYNADVAAWAHDSGPPPAVPPEMATWYDTCDIRVFPGHASTIAVNSLKDVANFIVGVDRVAAVEPRATVSIGPVRSGSNVNLQFGLYGKALGDIVKKYNVDVAAWAHDSGPPPPVPIEMRNWFGVFDGHIINAGISHLDVGIWGKELRAVKLKYDADLASWEHDGPPIPIPEELVTYLATFDSTVILGVGDQEMAVSEKKKPPTAFVKISNGVGAVMALKALRPVTGIKVSNPAAMALAVAEPVPLWGFRAIEGALHTESVEPSPTAYFMSLTTSVRRSFSGTESYPLFESSGITGSAPATVVVAESKPGFVLHHTHDMSVRELDLWMSGTMQSGGSPMSLIAATVDACKLRLLNPANGLMALNPAPDRASLTSFGDKAVWFKVAEPKAAPRFLLSQSIPLNMAIAEPNGTLSLRSVTSSAASMTAIPVAANAEYFRAVSVRTP